MSEEQTGGSGFKVVDRRAFSSDGTRRQGQPEDAERRHETPTPPSTPESSPIEVDQEEYAEPEGTGFEALVSYLSTTAMFQLGLLPGPGGERIPPDFVNAQRSIDLLEVLQKKTRGNLTPDEGRLLEDVLYELRMSFVETEKRRAKKAK